MMDKKSGVQSLERAFGLIETLGKSGGGMSITSLCAATGLHKSTAHRLLAALKAMGYVLQDGNGTYRLTFKVCLLSRQVIDGVSLVSVAKPYMKTLCDVSQETTHLVVREGINTVYLHREECTTTPFRMISNVGLPRPMHTTAVGKSILATLSDEEISEYWTKADKGRITDNTICDLPTLMAHIADGRARTYSVDNEENNLGVRCMAVAITDYLGRGNAAISITGTKDRMTDRRMLDLLPYLQRARDEIMAGMGYGKK